MAVLEMSARQREQPREFTGAGLRTIGGPREFSAFAVLVLCFAISVGFVVHREHRAVAGPAIKPAAVMHPVTAPSPRSAPVPSSPVSFTSDDTAAIGAVFANLVNSAADGVGTIVDSVWEPALWLSNRIVSFVADSWVNPVTGDRLFLNAAPNAFNLAVAILALAMVALVMVSLAGPLYVGWKSWRLSHAHVGRYR